MKDKSVHANRPKKMLIKKCHICGEIVESYVEVKKCPCCNKYFLPLNYFNKIQNTVKLDYSKLFSASDEIAEEDLIKGIYVLW